MAGTKKKKRKKKKKKSFISLWKKLSRRKKIFSICAVVLVIVCIVSAVRIRGYYSIPVSEGTYPIKGVDVSSYQGNIDWETIYRQDIAFAYIKATEGSSHVDRKFTANWKNVRKTDIRAGAYHFMSLETPGKRQAANFLRTVTKRSGMMPPVIDVEFYGSFSSNHPSRAAIQGILTPLLKEISSETGMEPIIYTTRYIYSNYISGSYDNDIWIADDTMKQPLPDGKSWKFCQYSFSGRLKGYSGGVKSIDLDVFNGDRGDFYRYK